MNRMGRIALATAIAVAGAAHVAAAQLPGIPYYPVNTGTGINVAADYGHGTGSGSGSAWGLSGGVGFSAFGASASFGNANPGSVSTIGGALGMKLLGGGLSPVTIGAQVGANHFSGGGLGYTNVLPGLWLKVSPPLFPLKPWAQVYYNVGTCTGTGCTTVKEARASIGANFSLLLGLGIHAAYDMGFKSGAAKGWGIGAHFNFRVPGL